MERLDQFVKTIFVCWGSTTWEERSSDEPGKSCSEEGDGDEGGEDAKEDEQGTVGEGD